jgi:TonB-linked SusC/RagA family outer membrane protein
MKKKLTNQLNNTQMKNNLSLFSTLDMFGLKSSKIFEFTRIMLSVMILFYFQNSSGQIVKQQDGNVKVHVVDELQKPISGVLVGSVSKPDLYAITDLDGNAVLNMNPSGLIKVYYDEREKMVTVHSNDVNIELKKSDKKVNVGFGQIKSVDETTTAIDLVYSDKLEKSSLLNPGESLYGKLKGLMVLQNGGEPWNRNPTMYIRGVATTNSNKILVLVDGFERELASLSLLDIESVSVLKDGTDVAKYGLRGANGVILVTTKRGKKDSFNVSASYDKGWNVPFRRPKFLDSYGYAKAVNQAGQNDGTPAVYSNQDLIDYKSGSKPYSHPNVDWWDETLKDNGVTNNFNTSFWGGGKSSTYFFSLNYQNERGLLDNTDLDSRYDSSLKYDRLNFRANLDIDLTNTTKFILDASGYIGGQNEPNRRTSSIMDAIYSIPSAVFPVKYESGVWGGTNFYTNNPVAGASSTGNSKPNYRTLYANGKLVQDLGGWVKGLSAELSLAYDNYASFFENNAKTFLYGGVSFVPKLDSNGLPVLDANGIPITTTVNGKPLGADNDLVPSQSFGDQIRHATGSAKINYVAKWNQNKLTSSVFYQEDKRVLDGQYNTFLRNNLFASTSYGYKNRYFMDGVVSYSGTNLLPQDGRFGIFPAVSAAWIVSRENFLKDFKNLNYFKIRGSWGKSGNDIIPANNLDRQFFNSGGSYTFGTGNVSNSGIREGRLAATGISFESSEKVNFGVNMELFHNLTFSIDAFRDKRTDIIISTTGAVPALLGVTPSFDNAGEVVNKGIEGSFMFKKKVDELNYFIGGNFTYAKNKRININEEYTPFAYNRETGQSIGQRFGLQSIGFFQNQEDINNSPRQVFSAVRPGDIKYKDQNNDGVIDNQDNVAIGYSSSTPELYYALNFGFSIRGFGLDILMQGIANQTLYLNTKSVFWPLVGGTNIGENSAGAWTPETAGTATLPRLTLVSNDNNYRPNDIWFRSGNYIKMRHFEMFYNIPDEFAKKIRMTKAKLYIRGMNLFSIDNINIADPESIGISYPTLSSYHVGFNVEF